MLVTSAAQDPSQLPPAGQRFVRAFGERYGREPGRYAAYGYEAMAVVLDSIRRAGDQGDDRDSVVDAFFDTQDRDSVLGTYSIDEVGDTTLTGLAGYRVSDGRPVFANRASRALSASAPQEVPERRLELRVAELEAGVERRGAAPRAGRRRRPRPARLRT